MARRIAVTVSLRMVDVTDHASATVSGHDFDASGFTDDALAEVVVAAIEAAARPVRERERAPEPADSGPDYGHVQPAAPLTAPLTALEADRSARARGPG